MCGGSGPCPHVGQNVDPGVTSPPARSRTGLGLHSNQYLSEALGSPLGAQQPWGIHQGAQEVTSLLDLHSGRHAGMVPNRRTQPTQIRSTATSLWLGGNERSVMVKFHTVSAPYSSIPTTITATTFPTLCSGCFRPRSGHSPTLKGYTPCVIRNLTKGSCRSIYITSILRG